MAADHAIQAFGGLGVALHLGAHQFDGINAHQFHLDKIAGLIELKVLVQALDEHIKHLLLFGRQAAVGKDAVFEAVEVALRRTTSVLGRFGLALVPVPAIKVL